MPKKKPGPELPVGPLPDLMKWWKSAKVSGAIFGGLAVTLLTKSRSTEDVDATIILDDSNIDNFIVQGKAFGFRPRISEAAAFAKRSRMILVEHAPSEIDIDLAIAGTSFEIDAIARARRVRVGRTSAPLVTTEDLIVFKVLANRDIDRSDVAHLLEFFPDLDVEFIRRQLSGFAEMLDEPDILGRLVDYRAFRRGGK